VWQVLWVELDRGKQPPAAAALRAQFAVHGGRLLGQLYDLNCRRQFCSPELFVPEHLGLDRLLAEATAARGGAPWGGGASSSSGGGVGEVGRGRPGGRLLALSGGTSRIWQLLQLAPCLIPFRVRGWRVGGGGREGGVGLQCVL
jgi:hypothetical protein